MIEINLIPDVKRELLRARMLRNTIISLSVLVSIIAIATVTVLGLIFGGQLAFESTQDTSIKKKYDELMQVADLNKTVTLQQQLTQITAMHEGKKINSRLFDVVRAVNPAAPNNVQFASVKLDPEAKTITMDGSAENGYAALEVLKKTIGNTRVRSAAANEDDKGSPLANTIVDGETGFGENTSGKKVLRFSFSFTYPDELFANTKDGVAIVTPTGKVDVTDSRIGIPESLFAKHDTPKQDDAKEQP